MSCSNQIICYTSPHLSLHVPFFFLLIILTHCYVIVNSFYYPPLQAYLQYKKSLSNIIHLSHRQIQVCLILIIFGAWEKINSPCAPYLHYQDGRKKEQSCNQAVFFGLPRFLCSGSLLNAFFISSTEPYRSIAISLKMMSSASGRSDNRRIRSALVSFLSYTR